ncbi:hypothetical protein [Myroides marinus]|uniref:hypothetical protein n=1 Tax=Myroides marinus TaxID=703342 RepID=UPI0025767974|nr:hypothetical protein [Myroides marinus]MDM1534220.1 hypothetical protein [Myroides marinus]MDM1541184.1 hypothetical protein [Myroides marinus]
MEQKVKNDWIINNQNIFGLQQDINLSISGIQYEILNQSKDKDINSIEDYLGIEIDISKEIRLTKNLTIEKVFSEFLDFENFNPLEQNTFNCSLILGYLQLSLFKEYSENKNKNILTFSEYKTQYSSLLNNFLTSNMDTDEQDFIKAELTLCNNLLTEMNKPIYSVLSLLNEVLDKPCEYKKNLTNSIDKRKKFLEQKVNEKYPKVKALFHFIEYLHSNIENFNQYNGLIKELEQLNKERNQLKPRNNYKDKQQYDIIQAELESKFKTLQDNTANLIKAKARELNVCNFDCEPNYNFNGVETEILQLKDNFSNEDLPEIFIHKSQYIEYRSQTHGTFLSLQFFFDELDEISKTLFDYFKDTDQNEFKTFEIKATPVNSIVEAIQGFKKGQTKFTLLSSFLSNTSSNEQPKNQVLPPQPIDKNTTIRYTAKHYVLAYLIECNAKGESFPIGQKKELEKIGNKKIGIGKGNRFYKAFNEVVNKDLNVENNLIEIGGKNWRTIVKDLSDEPETIEAYLQSKQL